MGWQWHSECYKCQLTDNDIRLNICAGCIDVHLDPPSKDFVETQISCDTCYVCLREGRFVVCIKTCDECASDLFKKGHITRLAYKMERAAKRKEEWDACCSGYKDWVDDPVKEFLSDDE